MDERLKLLLVEDDEVHRAMVRDALNASGMPADFDEVPDAAAAVRALKEEVYDCAVIDYRLPGANGLSVLRQARQAGINTPVIMLTGQGDEQLAADIMKAGASDYLPKDRLSRDLLSHSVRHVVGLYRAQMQADLARALSLESEGRFRQMADSVPVPLWVTDENGLCIYLNKMWFDFTGRTPEQSLGLGWRERIHPDDLKRLTAVRTAALERREKYELEYRLRRRDGEYRWVIGAATPWLLPDGKFAGFIGSCTDITERKRAEQERAELLSRECEARAAAEANERHYRFLAEFIPQIIFTAGPDGDPDYFSRRWLEYTGLQREDGLHGGWQQIVHPDDLSLCLDRWARSLATGQPYEVEHRLRRHDRVYRWHLGRAEPLRDFEGKIVRWFGTYTDIEDQKRSEESLHFLAAASEVLASSLNYEATLASVARLAVPKVADWCAVDIADADGTLRRLAVVHHDPAKLRLGEELRRCYPPQPDDPYGVNSVVRTGKSWLQADIPDELIDSGAHDAGHAALLRKLGLGSAMVVPLLARDKVLGAITFVCAGSDYHYGPRDLALAEDLARRAATAVDNARLYGELKEAKDAAEAANAAKDQFLAVLSHELRTPLTPVLSTVQAMESDPLLPDQLRESVDMIRRNAELEARLIDDLLDLTRIAKGKLELHLQAVDVHECLRNALDICYDELRGRGQHLVLKLEAKHRFVRGDAARLHQVFWNLIKNAIKFTPEGGWITIRSGNEHDGQLRVEVRDTGIGIEPQMLPRIFEAFEQGERAITRRFGGLGLGLAISKTLVEKQNGTLTVDSSGRNKGTVFVVTMPVTTDHEIKPRPFASNDAAPPDGLRILLVDDHEDTARAMRRLLERLGYDIALAGTVHDALDVIDRQEVDLLISDIGLPDGSGLELMRQIRRQKNLRGIALSGFGMEEDIRKSREAGFAEHLTKPVNFQKLEAVIRQVASEPT